MLSLVKRQLFAHDLINPPSEGSSYDITLKLVSSKGCINLTKVSAGFQTEYLLSIPDAKSLGLTSSQQNEVDLFIGNLVLAANLVLRRVALSTIEGRLPESQVEFKQHEPEVVVENRPNGKHVTVTDRAYARACFHVMKSFAEEMDENKVVSYLQFVNKIAIVEPPNKNRLELVNLKKSFNEYRNAMSVFDNLMIFKSLFNSLEFATNFNGKNRREQELDNEVAKITGLQILDVCKWRQFYNRTKHPDRTPEEVKDFSMGKENLHEFIAPLRLAVEAVIIDRLNRLQDH